MLSITESGLAMRGLLASRLAPLTPEQDALFHAVDWPNAFNVPDGREPADFERFADSLTTPQLDALNGAYIDLRRSFFIQGGA